MRSRGVEVLLLHESLSQPLEDREGRDWLLSRRVRPEEVTALFDEPLRAWFDGMPADELATRLTGGVTVLELPDDVRFVIGPALRPTDFSCRRYRISSSPATRAPGSTAASR